MPPRRRRPLVAKATASSPTPPGIDHRTLEAIADDVVPLVAAGAAVVVPAPSPATVKLDALARTLRTFAQACAALVLVDLVPLALGWLDGTAHVSAGEVLRAGLRPLVTAAAAWAMRYARPPAWPDTLPPADAGRLTPLGAILLAAFAVVVAALIWPIAARAW